ncbi:hypothetical protein BSM4216_0986 [Bacillus smithii]|nr:hypothetical protein BSM4216_0986 [Bacillus smithii]
MNEQTGSQGKMTQGHRLFDDREIHSLSAGDPRASSLVPRCGVSPGSLFSQESRQFRDHRSKM